MPTSTSSVSTPIDPDALRATLTDHFTFPDIFECHRQTTPNAALIIVPYDNLDTSPGYLHVPVDGPAAYINEPFARSESVLGARPLKAYQNEWRDVNRVTSVDGLIALIHAEQQLLDEVVR